VRALVRPSSVAPDLAGLDVEIVRGDIGRAESLEAAFAGCGAFVHAAGFYPTVTCSPSSAVAAGLASVLPVLEAALAARLERGVYVSSLSTIGPARPTGSDGAAAGGPAAGGGPGTRTPLLAREEDGGSPWAGADPYSAAKAAMEWAALESAAKGLPLAVVNPTLCLGEYDRKPTSGRIVLKAAGGRLPFYLDAPVNVVYTGDVGLGIARALERGRAGQRYILGGTNTSFRWLLRQIAFEAGSRPPRFPLPLGVAGAAARARDLASGLSGQAQLAATAVGLITRSQHFDCAKAARELGLVETTPAVETVRRAVRWFREVGMLRGP
jgi:dihydroflavonol-4-reductase